MIPPHPPTNARACFALPQSKLRNQKAWRKILSDVDDTLSSSGGSYPAGIDRRYGKKVIYPGVLSFYRELDLGVNGPRKWPENSVGNLVFLSARPHVYKDHSERRNYAKFAKLRERGMHTNPSLLSGDMTSGTEYMFKKDLEPMSMKKFQVSAPSSMILVWIGRRKILTAALEFQGVYVDLPRVQARLHWRQRSG